MSRLIEPTSEAILAPAGQETNSGQRQPNLAKGSSVISVNTSQLLLQEAFDMFFRDFHEFLAVHKNVRENIDLALLQKYRDEC